MSKKISFILVISLILISLILLPFISAQEKNLLQKSYDITKTSWESIKDFFKNTKAYLADTGPKAIFGFEMKPSWIGSFLIGFFTGFMIWLVYFLIRLYHFFSDKLVIDKDEEFLTQEGGIRWLNLVAGRIWKVPLIGLLYMVLSQIPIINRIVQAITFQFLFINWFWTSLVIAIEIGFLPFIFEETRKIMYETKLREKLLKNMSTRYN